MATDAGTGDHLDARSFATPARVRLAEAVRRLIDATLTTARASEEQLAAAAGRVESIAIALARDDRPAPRPATVLAPGGRSHDDYLPRSPLVGDVSPVAPPFSWEPGHGRVRGRGVFGAAHEGPPGYVHGGWVALAFDEILGIANIASGNPAMTGRLAVRYRRPTPLHREACLEAWTDRAEGRRIVARGTLAVGGVVTAEAEGLFVVIGPEQAAEYFG